jgi:hypothetical protein
MEKKNHEPMILETQASAACTSAPSVSPGYAPNTHSTVTISVKYAM